MSDIGNRMPLFAYWLSEGINPLILASDADPTDIDRHRVERDCFFAEVSFPTLEEARQALQALSDEGYLLARRESERMLGRPIQIKKLNETGLAALWNTLRDKDPDPFYLIFELTSDGQREAESFRERLLGQEGRQLSMQFARERLAAETQALSFQATIPGYVPDNLDPLPDVAVLTEADSVTIRYHGSGIDQIFVDQTSQDLGEEDIQVQSETTREDRIAGVSVSVRERQLTPSWAELSIGWDHGEVAYRVSYHRSTAVVDDGDEEAVEDRANRLADITADEFEPADRDEFEPIVIDDQMREEARRVATSLIEQRT